MTETEKTPDQIAAVLLKYLQTELGDASLALDSPLTRLQGGFETLIYRFTLQGAKAEFSKPLVLRLFPAYHGLEKAGRESAIQNALADQGFPVPRIYFTCTDLTLLDGAFCIMEFIEGDSMLAAPIEALPVMLGRLQAWLHDIDPRPIVEKLRERGVNEDRVSWRLAWMNEYAEKSYPWLRDGVRWLLENRPPEPEKLSVCHGDFHPINILMKAGTVAGVLDWGSFLIADPALDVAFTLELIILIGNRVLPLTEIDALIEKYLEAYADKRPLAFDRLDYYRVLRCIAALIEGALGQEIWRTLDIVKNLSDTIHQVTNIRISPPGIN